MDSERAKAMIRRYLVQLRSFEGLLFPSFDRQPTWDVWADSCHAISDLATNLSTVASDMATEYELSIKEQEGIH